MRVNFASVPEVKLSATTLDRFWKKVAELTTRHHDVHKRWKGTDELRQWNMDNKKACRKCTHSKTKCPCIIDIDHPSCRACRDVKVACSRKAAFVYDMTKEDYFPDFKQFLSVFQDRNPEQLKKLRKHEQKYTIRVKYETDGLLEMPKEEDPVRNLANAGYRMECNQTPPEYMHPAEIYPKATFCKNPGDQTARNEIVPLLRSTSLAIDPVLRTLETIAQQKAQDIEQQRANGRMLTDQLWILRPELSKLMEATDEG
ncbi:hypothetical protein C8R43DRAFT_1032102 [Mycena crocata]|nr:hypothetical protein C8R43DRAFT_1032102 [Mycena crocata]